MRNQHNWNERTEEGEKRCLRATKFGGRWTIQTKLEEEEFWTTLHDPGLEDVKALYDVIFRKYQRKRLSYDDVASVEAWLKRLGG